MSGDNPLARKGSRDISSSVTTASTRPTSTLYLRIGLTVRGRYKPVTLGVPTLIARRHLVRQGGHCSPCKIPAFLQQP